MAILFSNADALVLLPYHLILLLSVPPIILFTFSPCLSNRGVTTFAIFFVLSYFQYPSLTNFFNCCYLPIFAVCTNFSRYHYYFILFFTGGEVLFQTVFSKAYLSSPLFYPGLLPLVSRAKFAVIYLEYILSCVKLFFLSN